MLSYRHAFHAGNHADVLKHFVLLELLRYMNRKDKPWWYVDTHAGAGCYVLNGEYAEQGREYVNGAGRLWQAHDLPEALRPYREVIAQFNPHGNLNFYPGSPAIAMTQLRSQDRMRLFEMHPADFVSLQRTFEREGERVLLGRSDGFAGLKALLPPSSRRAVTLIDPSYEVKTDYQTVVKSLADSLRRFPTGTYALWYPLLRREEARRLAERLETLATDNWLDVRLLVSKPAKDGFGMFGSGMYVVNPPWLLPQTLEAVMPWLTKTLALDDGADFSLNYEIE